MKRQSLFGAWICNFIYALSRFARSDYLKNAKDFNETSKR